MSTYTAIILSENPTTKTLPLDVAVVNEVSTFTNLAGDYAARLRAIKRVQTSHFFFIDEDDPYVHQCWASPTLTIGTEYWESPELKFNLVRKPPMYKSADHLCSPQYVHNATCVNTAAALSVLARMPSEGEYYFQHMFYFILAKEAPPHIEPRLVYKWQVTKEGMNAKARVAIENTKQWLSTNFEVECAKLEQALAERSPIPLVQ